MNKNTLRARIAGHLPFFLSTPGLVWQVLFFYVPTFLIIALSVLHKTGFCCTFEHYFACLNATYLLIIARSLIMAFVTVFFCIVIAYPVCYYLAVHLERAKNVLLFFLILPFWTSVMVQIYAWFFVLDRHGLINSLLMKCSLISTPLALLNTTFAVYVVMVYCYLPFMIMPLYAQLEKLDRGLLEASADLGASSWQTFARITIPLSLPGIRTGFFLVLVPSFGELAIPSLLSGGKQLFVGSVISQFFISAQEPYQGAAFTVLSCIALGLAVGISYLYFSWLAKRYERGTL